MNIHRLPRGTNEEYNRNDILSTTLPYRISFLFPLIWFTFSLASDCFEGTDFFF
jgi:hypothetical protein